LSGRHGQKHKSQKKKATATPPTGQNVKPPTKVAEAEPEQTLCQPNQEEKKTTQMPSKEIRKPDAFDIALWGLVLAFAVGIVYFLQLRSMLDSGAFPQEHAN